MQHSEAMSENKQKGRCTGKVFREIVLQITKIIVGNYLFIMHFSKKQFNIIIVKHVKKAVNKMFVNTVKYAIL